MGDPITLAIELTKLAVGLLSKEVTPEQAHKRVRDLFPDKSESEKAAEDIEAGRG